MQVNKDIVSGLKYTQQTFRKGVRGMLSHFDLDGECSFFNVFVV